MDRGYLGSAGNASADSREILSLESVQEHLLAYAVCLKSLAVNIYA